MQVAVAKIAPSLEECACPDCYEAVLAARAAVRATAVRTAAIRAYARGERTGFALRFAEEVLGGWDQ